MISIPGLSKIRRREFMMASTGAALLAPLLPANDKQILRVGQIGTQHAHAAGKLEAMRYLKDDYQVVGIVESNATARKSAERNKTYAEIPWLDETTLLNDPAVSIVAIETTLEDSTPAAARAISAGKHIHLDKPGGNNHTAFKSLRLSAEKRGLQVQMGYMLRHNPAFSLLFRAVREGWLGDVQEVTATMGKQADSGLRRTLAALPGHGMFELACHLVDAVVTILGAPKQVHAFGVATQAPNDSLLDNQLAVLEYPKALVTLRCNHNDPGGGPRRAFSVVGSLGSMDIAPLESGKVSLKLLQRCDLFSAGEHKLSLPMPRGRYDEEFIALAKWVRGQEKSPWSAAHDITVHATALGAAGCKIE